MFEQFSNYPEITWTAATAARFMRAGEKFPVNPDLENFRLVRFKDLQKQPKVNKESHLKLMLIGSSDTNVFIDGPDSQIDEIIKRLPKYIGKSWSEINSMRLEKDSLNCENFEKSVCNPELLSILELEPIKSGEEVPELDFKKADEICAKCEYFEPK